MTTACLDSLDAVDWGVFGALGQVDNHPAGLHGTAREAAGRNPPLERDARPDPPRCPVATPPGASPTASSRPGSDPIPFRARHHAAQDPHGALS